MGATLHQRGLRQKDVLGVESAELGRLVRRLGSILRGDRPLRNLVARALWLTRLSKFFLIKKNGYVLRFYPTSLSCAYWINPSDREIDERVVGALLDDGSTYIDVGANIGALAALAAVKVGPLGAVHAIEPNPRVSGYLRSNLALNEFANVTVYAVAAGAEEGTVYISNARADDMNFVSTTDGDRVTMIRLDDLLDSVTSVDLLKVDVEGFEKFVFLGAKRLLSVTSFVFFEACNTGSTQRYDYELDEVIHILAESGFRCCKVTSDGYLEAGMPSLGKCANLIAARSSAELSRRWIQVRDRPS